MRRIRSDLVLWDVMEEHLEEAGFLWSRWEDCLQAPDYTLAQVSELVESRLLAHLDGLLLGGPLVADRLLLPALQEHDPEMVFTAAFVLALSGSSDHLDAVASALVQAREEESRILAIGRALQLAPLRAMGARLRALLASGAPRVKEAALDILSFHHMDTTAVLRETLADGNMDVLRAALGALRFARQDTFRSLVELSLAHPEPAVRDAALTTGLIWDLPSAWETCRALVVSRPADIRLPLLLLALLGPPHELGPLWKALEQPEHAEAALFALGFSGQVGVADACVHLMQRGTLARLAGEAFAHITGLDLEAAGLAAAPEGPDRPGEMDEKLDEDEQDLAEVRQTSAEERLPLPDPHGVSAWWRAHRCLFDESRRYLLGRPVGPTSLALALQQAPMRRRRALALELAVRSRGAHQVETTALTGRQMRQISLVRAAGEPSPDGAAGRV